MNKFSLFLDDNECMDFNDSFANNHDKEYELPNFNEMDKPYFSDSLDAHKIEDENIRMHKNILPYKFEAENHIDSQQIQSKPTTGMFQKESDFLSIIPNSELDSEILSNAENEKERTGIHNIGQRNINEMAIQTDGTNTFAKLASKDNKEEIGSLLYQNSPVKPALANNLNESLGNVRNNKEEGEKNIMEEIKSSENLNTITSKNGKPKKFSQRNDVVYKTLIRSIKKFYNRVC